MEISHLAGKPADPDSLVNVPELVTAYYTETPDPSVPVQQVSFGTSGHRGSSFEKAFNEWHILTISQVICLYRNLHKIDGPLFLGLDTHALSVPALASALEVLAANGVEVMLAEGDKYTSTPAISLAILTYNRGRKTGLADGIVITPSHNPPHDGGFKYNPPNGGPEEGIITDLIQAKANQFLESGLKGIKRFPLQKALRASTTHRYDYLNTYINELPQVVDMDTIRASKISLGVDPLGGAGVHYWEPIAERFGLNLTVVNRAVDPTFRFMTVDWDGQIRMDLSSPYAMQRLIGLKDQFELTYTCDTDHDRHGIVTRSAGLLPPNYYLSVAIYYLFQHRPKWSKAAAVGKALVSSQMIDRVAAKLNRKLYEVPVGFKWFVEGLLDGSLVLAVKRARRRLSPAWMAAFGPRTKMEWSRRRLQRRSQPGWVATPARSIPSSRASLVSRFTSALRPQPLHNKRLKWRSPLRSRLKSKTWLVKNPGCLYPRAG
jgi:phosphoglucomutase